MPRHISLLFPGQGSQSIGMLDAFTKAEKNNTLAISEDLFNFDLFEVVCNGPEELLNKTSITQPAILATSIIYYEKFIAITNKKPDLCAGHSLGEYSALVASESITLKKGLELVNKRGNLMEACSKGSMFAILNLDIKTIKEICLKVEKDTGDTVSPANINSIKQVVIAGTDSAASIAAEECLSNGAKRAIKLNVSVASHCELMRSASESLAKELTDYSFLTPTFPIIHNFDALIEKDSNAIPKKLISQLTSPVQWSKSMEIIKKFDGIVVECGPGKVLSGLAKANGLDNILSMSSKTFKEDFKKII